MLWAIQEIRLPDVMSHFMKQYYLDAPIPTEILVQCDIPDLDLSPHGSDRVGRSSHNNATRGDKKKMPLWL